MGRNRISDKENGQLVFCNILYQLFFPPFYSSVGSPISIRRGKNWFKSSQNTATQTVPLKYDPYDHFMGRS